MGGFAEMYSQEKGRGLQKVSLALGGEQKWDDTSGGGGAGRAPAWSWHPGRMAEGGSD